MYVYRVNVLNCSTSLLIKVLRVTANSQQYVTSGLEKKVPILSIRILLETGFVWVFEMIYVFSFSSQMISLLHIRGVSKIQ